MYLVSLNCTLKNKTVNFGYIYFTTVKKKKPRRVSWRRLYLSRDLKDEKHQSGFPLVQLIGRACAKTLW